MSTSLLHLRCFRKLGPVALFGRASDHLPLSLSSLTAEVESVRAVSVSQNGGQLYSTRLHVSF